MSNLKTRPSILNPAGIKAEIARIAGLSQTGKLEDAEARARALHKAAPQRADVNDALSLVLVDRRRPHEALPYAKAAAAVEPRNAGYLVNLGRLHLDLEQIEFAHPVLEKAFAIDPKLYQAPWNLAEFYFQIGKGETAAGYFAQALKAAGEADDKMLIVEDYCHCAVASGDVDTAERLANEMLGHRRLRIAALLTLADIRKPALDAPIVADIRGELDNANLREGQRSTLLLALGRIHESAKDYGEAFRLFNQSRALLKPMTEEELKLKDVSKLIEEYTPEVFERLKAYGHPSEIPVFVVGMPRSGTTLTEQIIASHPQAAGAGELGRIPKMNRNLSGENGPKGLFAKMEEVGPERWRQIPEDYLRLVRFLAPEAKRVVDKMPHNFMNLGFIRLCFPKARIVHCRRHPGDTFLSAYQHAMKRGHSYSYEMMTYARHYADYRKLMAHWKPLMGEGIFELHYEELASDQEIQIRKLLDFLGLPFDAACLAPHERKSAVRTISRLQVKNPINPASIGRWRNYEVELKPLLDYLGVVASSPSASKSGER